MPCPEREKTRKTEDYLGLWLYENIDEDRLSELFYYDYLCCQLSLVLLAGRFLN
ncbi:hypothetical protein HMPREF1981_02544 [Bacteroides pyogenes F0041]|uniref:Uncharacterized protein n=1 Tax=Bacteroides pyogenes F0041 TaxID=1321819 RepID=U2DVV0_9BACE|nr:hypothetical protein HMPREF1981_02544 [Bacteroides pyogenes F0041]MBB3894619.1 hypothetical protein [Bacteroides pyogenes]GAE22153.1 hypothetical protein JCM10003_1717 [Bacteroides pyogenes JCM 10003]SUV32699.1 Uncharacterised protein [Bacteroides pyogenes]